jgi:hypothetical protein
MNEADKFRRAYAWMALNELERVLVEFPRLQLRRNHIWSAQSRSTRAATGRGVKVSTGAASWSCAAASPRLWGRSWLIGAVFSLTCDEWKGQLMQRIVRLWYGFRCAIGWHEWTDPCWGKLTEHHVLYTEFCRNCDVATRDVRTPLKEVVD